MNQLPLFAIDDEETQLRPEAPKGPRRGMFGAGQLQRGIGGNLSRIGAMLKDMGGGAAGGPMGHSAALREQEEKEQAAADWRAMLGGMELSPEEMSYATENPAAFKEHMFKQQQAEKQREEMTSLLDGINIDPTTAALVRLNPEEGMKQLARTAATAQTGTYRDPISGKWNREPTFDGGFDVTFDADGNPTMEQRPESWDEINEKERLRIAGVNATESGRSNLANEEIKREEAITGRMNAETGARNSMKGTGGIDTPIVPRGPSPTEGQGFDPGRFDGAKIVPIGYGQRGEWVRGPSDGELLNGIPTPIQNDLDLVDGKDADAVLKMERDELKKATELQDMLSKRASQANEFLTITQEGDKPYITGPGIWMATNKPLEFATQWTDPRGDRLDKLNKELTIDMGQGMKGAFSDADREFLRRGVPSRETREESNVDFAARSVAASNRASQYVSWLLNYERAFKAGSQRSAKAYWDDYSKAQPVFDKNGKPRENVPTITEWFAGNYEGAEGAPFKRPVSPAYTDSKAKTKSAAEASDDELKEALGLK